MKTLSIVRGRAQAKGFDSVWNSSVNKLGTIYMVADSLAATIDAVISAGGEIVQPIGADAPEITARFRDPGGNVIGL